MATIQRDISIAPEESKHHVVSAWSPRLGVRPFVLHGSVAVVCVIAIFFLHELNHAAAVLILGGRVTTLNVLGVQWFPALRLTPEFGYGGYVAWLIPRNYLRTDLIVVAGSTGTLLIAFCAVAAMNLFRPRGLMRTALVLLSLYFVDSIIHILPVLARTSNYAPAWVRSFSETFYALMDLGVPGSYYIISLFLSTAIILALLVLGILRSRSSP